MTFREFAQLVEKLRQAQIEYFRGRKDKRGLNIGECITLERAVDAALKKILTPSIPGTTDEDTVQYDTHA